MREGRIRVLLVEDDKDDALLIREMLAEAAGVEFEMQEADRLSKALRVLADGVLDVVLLDLGLPDSVGMETFDSVVGAAPQVPIVVLTGLADQDLALRAVQEGAQDYLVKSQVNADLLTRAVRYAVVRAIARRHQALQKQVLDSLNSQPCLDMGALKEVLRTVKDTLGIQMAALRLRIGEHWTLHVHVGLHDGLLERVDHLCTVGPDGEVRRDAQGRLIFDCLCGSILSRGTVDWPDGVTAEGSFWTNSTASMRSGLSGGPGQVPIRDCCTLGGCESVALLPLQSEQEVIGLLHFADPQAGVFTTDTVDLLEDIADSIGTALTRQRAEDALRKYAARVEVLRAVGEAILAAESVAEIAQAALDYLPRLVSCCRASVVEFDLPAGTGNLLAVYHESDYSGPPVGSAVPLEIFGELESLGANRTRRIADLRAIQDPAPAMQALIAGSVRSVVSVPLMVEDKLIGSLNVGWQEPGTPTEEDQDIVRELADVLSIALGGARTRQQREAAQHDLDAMNYQMRVARHIQQALYPTSAPELAGFDLAGESVPAQAAGGDYYDYIPMPDGYLGIAVGDVTGHGVGAALVMASMRAYLRVLARTATDVCEILTRANQALVLDTAQDIFCTLFFCRLDPRTGTMVYVNAGHPPAYLFAASGEVTARLESTSVPLGLMPDAEFPAGAPVNLPPGELAFLCTDGVLDVASGAGSRFGVEHVLEVVRSNRQEPAQQIVTEVCRAVLRFCEPELPADDVTAVVIKANPPVPSRHGT